MDAFLVGGIVLLSSLVIFLVAGILGYLIYEQRSMIILYLV